MQILMTDEFNNPIFHYIELDNYTIYFDEKEKYLGYYSKKNSLLVSKDGNKIGSIASVDKLITYEKSKIDPNYEPPKPNPDRAFFAKPWKIDLNIFLKSILNLE